MAQRGARPVDTASAGSEIARELRTRFPGARHDFFPDVTPASVHNTYVQMLADLGLIGFVLFITAIRLDRAGDR
jgi:hypothetical protein